MNVQLKELLEDMPSWGMLMAAAVAVCYCACVCIVQRYSSRGVVRSPVCICVCWGRSRSPSCIIVIMVDSIHDPAHSAAAGVPTLAQSSGAVGAGERGALVMMSTGTACVGDGAMGGPRAKPRPCARVDLGLASANPRPGPARVAVRRLR